MAHAHVKTVETHQIQGVHDKHRLGIYVQLIAHGKVQRRENRSQSFGQEKFFFFVYICFTAEPITRLAAAYVKKM